MVGIVIVSESVTEKDLKMSKYGISMDYNYL